MTQRQTLTLSIIALALYAVAMYFITTQPRQLPPDTSEIDLWKARYEIQKGLAETLLARADSISRKRDTIYLDRITTSVKWRDRISVG